MKLFTIGREGKLIPYREKKFEQIKQEADLEDILENNSEYFFEDSNILIIGRQVTTNLNTFIDLLGIDKYGNTVVVELKRGRTPRETVAQVLEYASFVESLDYTQLNNIFQNYLGEEVSLEEYHKEYFKDSEFDEESVSFNKSVKLVIVAQDISREVKQTAVFLRKKGIDIYCIEFKYFETKSGERIITREVVVGKEDILRSMPKSASLPKINREQFLKSLDKNGYKVFQKLFEFADENALVFKWGSKGFSLNVDLEGNLVPLLFGYPPNSVFKQSIYTGNELILRKVNNGEEIVNMYVESLTKLGYFVKIKPKGEAVNLKWLINKEYSEEEISRFLKILQKVSLEIKERGLKTLES